MKSETRAAGARRGWEHRRERDERVLQNIPEDLAPLWERVKGALRCKTPHQCAELLVQYAHDHPREAVQAVADDADRKLAELVDAQERAAIAEEGNGHFRAWLDEQDAAQAEALGLRSRAARKRSLASAADGARLLPMARTAARRSMTRIRPVTVKPVVVRQTKIVKQKRKGHHRRGARGMLGGLLSENRTQIAIAGGIVGLIDKQGWSIPHLPWVGEHGTIAIAAYAISDNGRNKLADNVCTAAAVISLYELGKEGSISGGDWDEETADVFDDD